MTTFFPQEPTNESTAETQPPATGATTDSGNDNSGLFVGGSARDVTGNKFNSDNITNNTYISSNNKVLAFRNLSTPDIEPSDIKTWFSQRNPEKLKVTVLEGPPLWGVDDVAECLAQHILASQNPPWDEKVLVPTTEYSGWTILTALGAHKDIFDGSPDLFRNTVLMIKNAKATDYPPNILDQLTRYAKKHNIHVLLVTNERENLWKDSFSLVNFISLGEKGSIEPYTVEDLAYWACKTINETRGVVDKLFRLKVIGDIDKIEVDTSLNGITSQPTTLMGFIKAHVKSPLAVRNIVSYIQKAKKASNILTNMQDDTANQDERIKVWFNETLDDQERYMVVALSLINNISQQTFWAIYEKLISEHWRIRDKAMKMSDYLKIQAGLKGYIDTKDDKIVFVDGSVLTQLIDHALSSYRRSLITALPFLAELLSQVERPGVNSAASLKDNLYALEVWGADLTTSENRQSMRDSLRTSLISGIVRIDQQEPKTTENVFQAWAEESYFYPRYNSDPRYPLNQPNDETLRTKQAFSDILLAMYRKETKSGENNLHANQRSLNLLLRWYQHMRPESTATSTDGPKAIAQNLQALSDNDRDERRSNIRQTIAFTLIYLAKYLQPAAFGEWKSDDELFNGPPATLPKTEELKTLWHMLCVMAWEVDPRVRLVIAQQVLGLSQIQSADNENYIENYMMSMLRLLAGDGDIEVRIAIAFRLHWLVEQDSGRYLQFIHHLLLEKESDRPQKKVVKGHYFYQESNAQPQLVQHHLWTATLAMMLSAKTQPDAFRVYLRTLLEDENKPRFRAFRDVLSLASNKDNHEILKSALRLILNDRTNDKRLSAPAQALTEILPNEERTRLLTNAEEADFSEAQKFSKSPMHV